ncbi:MAG TPA: hypothetical protein DEB13_01100 [Candidatus Yanofskybacteria bacterium]|nr:hypothetical protein [Candidatus Yanofskybacteria bacterium]
MKAIFVDGEALGWMRQGLGIGAYRFSELYRILTTEIGKSAGLLPPVYVLSSGADQKIGKFLRAAGFVTKVVNAPRDDEFIQEQIKALPTEVTEVVLVAADSDFVPSLREVANRGITVFVVATRALQNGNSMVGVIMEDFLRENENTTFVDLEKYKAKLMKSSWVNHQLLEVAPNMGEVRIMKSPSLPLAPVRGERSSVISLTGSGEDVNAATSEIMSLLTRFPRLRVGINF